MGFFDGINFAVSDGTSGLVQGAAAGAAVGEAGSGLASWADVGTGTGTVGSTMGAVQSGGGIVMDRDEMTAFLQQVTQTRELCQQQVAGQYFLAGINPPAGDQASTMFTSAAQASRDARNKYLEQQLEMYTELVDKLSKALGYTTESDEQAASTLNQAAGGGKYS